MVGKIFGKKSQEEEKDKKSLKCSDAVWSDLDRYWKGFDANWEPECKLYYGQIWRSNEYKPYENNTYKLIEAQTAILTDSMSAPMVRVTDENFKEQAENLNHAIKWVFKDQSLVMKRTCAIRDGLIAAPGYLHVWYDHHADNGDGANRIEVLSKDQVRLDGAVGDITQSRKAAFEVYRDKEWLKQAYPGKANDLDKEEGEKGKSKDSGAHETRDVGGKHKNTKPERYQDNDLLTLRIVYKMDYSTVPIPEEETAAELAEEAEKLANGDSPDVNIRQDHQAHMIQHTEELVELYGQLNLSPEVGFDAARETAMALAEQNPEGGFEVIPIAIKLLEDHMEAHDVLSKENPKGHKLKFPGGWRVIETVNKIVLYDGPHRHDHLRIPIVPYYGNKDGTIYGFSEIKNIYDSEKMRAEMIYKEYKGLRKVANPSLLISTDSGLTKDDVSNEDGAIYHIQDINNSMRYMLPGETSNQVAAFHEKRAFNSQDIIGINEATQGKSPHFNSSGHAIDKLQQQAIGRLRLKERLYESHSDKILGTLVSSDVVQFWVNEKILHLEEKDNEAVQVIFNPIDMMELKYEFEMSSGSMAGVDKDAFNTLLSVWMDKGIITPDMYFEVAELPKKDKIRGLIADNTDKEAEMQAVIEEQTAEIQAQAQEAFAQAEAIQIENLKIRASLAPETLAPEEIKQLEEINRQETLALIQEQPTEELNETI